MYLTILYMKLSGIDTVSREATLSKLFLCQSAKGSTQKKNNLVPMGANSFGLE